VVHLDHTGDKPKEGLLPVGSLQTLPGSGPASVEDGGTGTAHTWVGYYNRSLCSESSFSQESGSETHA